jgi:hypothetical protein
MFTIGLMFPSDGDGLMFTTDGDELVENYSIE